MNIIELARKANILSDVELLPSNQWRHDTIRELETFARLVIEAHVRGVDVEPAIRESIAGNVITGYTATQMTAVRQRVLDEAAVLLKDAEYIIDRFERSEDSEEYKMDIAHWRDAVRALKGST